MLGIQDLTEKKFMQLSSGNKKKISFARALLRSPKVFLFDEITNSLDFESKNRVIEIIKTISINKRDTTIFWAT